MQILFMDQSFCFSFSIYFFSSKYSLDFHYGREPRHRGNGSGNEMKVFYKSLKWVSLFLSQPENLRIKKTPVYLAFTGVVC
jgi:hypothetical protein